MIYPTLEELLSDGFTLPRAKDYLRLQEEERNAPDGMFDQDYLEWSHAHGFLALNSYAYHLSEQTLDDYVNDYNYQRVWPLNSWQRIWINDKMTFKYMFNGTELDKYTPDTYFYSDAKRGILPLTEGGRVGSMDAFLGKLREVGEYAVKPCNGGRSEGFHKLGYKDGIYLVDNKPSTQEGVVEFVEANPNMIFTEFLHPSEQTAKISPVINNLRLLVFNPTGTNPQVGATYFRFAMDVHDDDSKANYVYPSDPDKGNYNVWFDWKTGYFGKGAMIYGNRVIETDISPDTGGKAEGILEGWETVVDVVLQMSDRLNALEYMGFDVCLTDKGPKIIEINSHSGCKYIQYFQPFNKSDITKDYFDRKLYDLSQLSESEIAARNKIMR